MFWDTPMFLYFPLVHVFRVHAIYEKFSLQIPLYFSYSTDKYNLKYELTIDIIWFLSHE